MSVCTPCRGQFLSPFFLVPKPDGTQRFILNLKNLNKFLEPEHFKMEDSRLAMRLIQPGYFMASLDLQDAYFMLPIACESRKFLRFLFDNVYYEFTCLPFGLNLAPRVFTKLLKPVLANLREKGFLSVAYLDDLLLFGSSYSNCLYNVKETAKLLTDLGFIINTRKSNLTPSTSCKFLGFVYDSQQMTLKVPSDKQMRTRESIITFLGKHRFKIRDLAKIIGTLVALCPATRYGWVYTKKLEHEKFVALSNSGGNFDAPMSLSWEARQDLKWWHNAVKDSFCPIRRFVFHLTIYTDASPTGWGAVCKTNKAHGHWNSVERSKHINYLELLAVLLGLKSLANTRSNCDILLRVDNTTAISYVNRMGGIQFPELNGVAREIWQWCEMRNIWIYASYIKSSDNSEADKESRRISPETEWSLAPVAFEKIVSVFGLPDIDLFASTNNKKCDKFVSWGRDSDAFAIDAFTLNWKKFFFYAFPPFSLIPKVLQKIVSDQASGIVIVPFWKTQPWYPLYTSLLTKEPILFKPNTDLLSFYNRSHPLSQNLTLVAGFLSGVPTSGNNYQLQQ